MKPMKFRLGIPQNGLIFNVFKVLIFVNVALINQLKPIFATLSILHISFGDEW